MKEELTPVSIEFFVEIFSVLGPLFLIAFVYAYIMDKRSDRAIEQMLYGDKYGGSREKRIEAERKQLQEREQKFEEEQKRKKLALQERKQKFEEEQKRKKLAKEAEEKCSNDDEPYWAEKHRKDFESYWANQADRERLKTENGERKPQESVDKATKIAKEIAEKRRKQNDAKQLRLNYQEANTEYSRQLTSVEPAYWKIYKFNVEQLPQTLHYTDLFSSLNNGVDIIDSKEILRNYFACYGGHHYHKLQSSCRILTDKIRTNSKITIVDYGCGQALATTVFYDYLSRNSISLDISELILIEPSKQALERGVLHLNKFIDNSKNKYPSVKIVNKTLNNLTSNDVRTNDSNIKIHLFSNILDVTAFSINDLATKIKHTQKNENYFVCVSPDNSTANTRISSFVSLFSDKSEIPAPSSSFDAKIYNAMSKRWSPKRITMFQRMFYCNFT